MKAKIAHTSIILALLITAGIFRENMFNAINYQIKCLQTQNDLWVFTDWYSFLNEKSLNGYMNLKWIFTIFFFLLHWAIAVYMVWALFYEKWNFRLVHGTWAVVFILAGIVYAIFGWMVAENTTQTKGYEFARLIMGAGQSPVLVMIVAVICRVRQKIFKSN